jgi:hypothetical protein
VTRRATESTLWREAKRIAAIRKELGCSEYKSNGPLVTLMTALHGLGDPPARVQEPEVAEGVPACSKRLSLTSGAPQRL